MPNANDLPAGAPCWFAMDSGKAFVAAEKPNIVSELSPGFYKYDLRGPGMFYFRQELSQEPVLRFSQAQSQLFNEIDRFWASRARYARFNIPFKRGLLLTGAPGTGKSTVVRKALQDVIAAGGYAIACCIVSELQRAIRDINLRHPSAPVVVVFEDLDAIIADSDNEEELTNILDGVSPVENCLFVATTNYEHKIPDRLRNRPGRFDRVIEIEFPDFDTRCLYISQLLNLPVDDKTVTEYATSAGQKSLAHVREYVIYREIYGDDEMMKVGTPGELHARVVKEAGGSKDKFALIKAYRDISGQSLSDAKAWVERNVDKLELAV